MSCRAKLPACIYHLALRGEWLEAANQRVAYRRSTLGKSLEAEGFIHCSFASQVQAIADALFQGREDVVLLTIDPSCVEAPIRVENLDGGEEMFPHIYGPVPLNAVTKTDRVPLSVGGRLVVDALVGGM